MIRNRSAPPVSVVPVLAYPEVAEAVEWLTRVLGFVEHVRIGDHRAQLGFGDGALIVADDGYGRRAPSGADDGATHIVMIRVHDIDEHHARAVAAGAQVLGLPTDQLYGERQYGLIDPAGHRWTVTQSIADRRPEEWGGTTVRSWS